ncbi:HNH nuclease [uncultured Caudovirales phage]|uniref:HNH nuclease n=1 Tax=uncultured Caudovirales phage TaxID=2100421 RepID=A0A6J5RTD8_9CAUD|nr:HNH nuclease [uncultured Caudovirales phage]
MNKYAFLYQAILTYELLATARKVHGPYTRDDGREFVIVVRDDGSRRTVSRPKFIMEEHLGYELDPDLHTIDHWDSNFLNNDINNLRIVPRKEHSADDTRRVKLVKFKCALCKNEFERSPRLVRDKAKKKKAGPFCSRKCAGKYARMLQLKLVDKFDVQPAVDSEYYKRKYITASIVTDDSFIDELCDIWEE